MSASTRPRGAADGSAERPSDTGKWELRLYVAGQTPKSVAAIANLQRLCEEYLPGRYMVEIVDLIAHPHLAKGDQIVAIPTLVRQLPPPIRKVIGDLSNVERTLVGLHYQESP